MSKIFRERSNIIFGFCIAAVICFAFYRFMVIAHSFPYYTSIDLDAATMIDSILIHSGYLPSHFVTPNFGTYLVFGFTQQIAYWLGHISISSLIDIKNSLDPIMGIAQLTDFLRFHSPYIYVGIGFFSWLSVSMHFAGNRPLNIFLLIVFLVQSSFNYGVMLIRPEAYSLFFWSIALFCGSFSIKTHGAAKKLLLIFCGLFLGLALMTKVQVIFLILFIPIIMLFFDSLSGYSSLKEKKTLLHPVAVSIISFIVLLLFVTFVLLAWQTVFPNGGFRTNRTFNHITIFIVATLILMLIQFLVPFFAFLVDYDKSWLSNLMSHSVLVFLGFILAFLLPILLFFNKVQVGFLYSMLLFKTIFLGKISSSLMQMERLFSLKSVLFYLKLYPLIFGSALVGVFICLVWRSNKRKIGSGYLILLFFIIITNTFLVLRSPNHSFVPEYCFDYIWFQTPLIIIAALIFNSILCCAKKSKMMILFVQIGICFFITGINLSAGAFPGFSMFREKFFFYNYYGGNQMLYADAITKAYSGKARNKLRCFAVTNGNVQSPRCLYFGLSIQKDRNKAIKIYDENQQISLKNARNYVAMCNFLHQVFDARNNVWRHTTILSPEFFINSNDYFIRVPASLKNSFVLIPSGISFEKTNHANYFKKIFTRAFTRHDYLIYLFVSKKHFHKIMLKSAGIKMNSIQVKSLIDGKISTYLGVFINSESFSKFNKLFDVYEFKDYFFVIKKVIM